jgi:hypothetical protein
LPALAATLVGGLILLVVSYLFIENTLHIRERNERVREERQRRRDVQKAILEIVRDELRTVGEDVERFLRMLEDDNAPYGRFGTNGWELLSEGGVLEGVDPQTSAALVTVYDNIRTMNGKLERFSEMKLGTMAVVMWSTTAAATRRRWRPPPAMRNIADQYEGLVLDLRKNICDRLPGLVSDADRAIRVVEAELNPRNVGTGV